jgi:serine/threonine-protein kinase RsbW
VTGVDGAATEGSQVGYGISLSLCLPRDALTVPVIRRLVRHALDLVGVLPDISADIEVALSEACANVLDHAGPGDAYDVSVKITPGWCELRVIDIGHGFDHALLAAREMSDEAGLSAEGGRGLGLMHALVDHIEFTSVPEAGTLVRLVKQLAFDESAPAQRLLAGARQTAPAGPGAGCPPHRAAAPEPA